MKKVFLNLILSLVLLVLNPESAHAQYPNSGYDIGRFRAQTENILNSEGSTSKYWNDILGSILYDTAGCIDNVTCPQDAPQSYKNSVNQRSLASTVDKVIIAIYSSPPATTMLAVNDLGQSLGFLPSQANAQTPGIGFAALSPILPVWRAFRNISYLLLAIILVVIGFMVMFRKNIDPKTVVTVQNAIPGIVVTLLLITFSYAIVGILVDIMYLLSLLIVSMLVPIGSETAAGNPWFKPEHYGSLLAGGWWELLSSVFGIGADTIDDVYVALFGGFISLGNLQASASLAILGGILGAIFAPPIALGTAIGATVGALLPILIVVFISLFIFFRIMFMTIGAYINIIISLISAPLHLLLGALPGNTAFSSWFANLVANLLVFPVTIGLLLISGILATAGQSGTLWTPPLVLIQGMGIQGIIALGILATIPNIVNSLKEQFKAKPPISPSIGSVIGPTASTFGMITQFGYQALFIKQALHQQRAENKDDAFERAKKHAEGKNPNAPHS